MFKQLRIVLAGVGKSKAWHQTFGVAVSVILAFRYNWLELSSLGHAACVINCACPTSGVGRHAGARAFVKAIHVFAKRLCIIHS
jgi:hypothetical protein